MTADEIRQVYAGPEAVVALVSRAFDLIAQQSQQIALLQQQNVSLVFQRQTIYPQFTT